MTPSESSAAQTQEPATNSSKGERKLLSIPRIGFVDLIGIPILLVAALKMPGVAGDPGVGWHLRSGEWMINELRIPRTDPFLFTSEGKSWIHNQWLSDLLLWKIFSFGGWPLLQWLVVGVGLAIVVLILPAALREAKRGPLAAATIPAVSLLFLSVQWFLRPVIFTFLLFAVLFRFVLAWVESWGTEREEACARRLRWVPLLFLLWANLHPGFVSGLVLLGLAGAAALFQKPAPLAVRLHRFSHIAFVGVFSLIATLVNPYGIALHINIAKLAATPYFMNLNQEWLSTDLHLSLFFPVAAVIVFIFVAGGRRSERKVSFFDLFTSAAFLFLALMQRRYIPFLGIVLVGPLSRIVSAGDVKKAPGVWRAALSSLARKEERATSGGPSILCWLGICVSIAVTHSILGRGPENFSPDRYFPHDGLRKLEQQLSTGERRVFHSPDWGGYLTLHLWPKLRPYLDDRNELSGQALYQEFFAAADALPGWEDIFERRKIDFAFLPPESALAFVLRRHPKWVVLHEDEQSVLFGRQNS